MFIDRELKSKGHAAKLAALKTTPEFELISKYMELADDAPATAVQQMLEITTSSCDLGTLGDHFYHTACSITVLSQRTAPEQQSKLVTFVAELRTNTIIDPRTGETLRYDGELVWTELPTFGWIFGDELHDGCKSLYAWIVAKIYLYP